MDAAGIQYCIGSVANLKNTFDLDFWTVEIVICVIYKLLISDPTSTYY